MINIRVESHGQGDMVSYLDTSVVYRKGSIMVVSLTNMKLLSLITQKFGQGKS